MMQSSSNMKKFLAASFLIGTSVWPVHAETIPPVNYNVLSWPRMSIPDFGCFLEKTFGFKDPKFNCSLKNYKPSGDPCSNTDGYYEGFEFPNELVSKIHPLLDNIGLAWEHGDLQSVSFSFKKKISSDALKKAFRIPNEKSYPENIMSIGIQNCSRDGVCLLIQGFDHMGAGEVDCDGGDN